VITEARSGDVVWLGFENDRSHLLPKRTVSSDCRCDTKDRGLLAWTSVDESW
jgi:hypothetical protein